MIPLGELADKASGVIKTGPFGSQLHESDYRAEGIPVVMPKDIVNGRISTKTIARIGPNDVSRLSQHKLEIGDIVYGRRGDIGRRAIVTKRERGWLCGTGCLRISGYADVLYPVFLYYYLGQKPVIDWIALQAIGATLPNLNTSIIRRIPIPQIELPVQKKIAAILSAYDDLIENNNRRIAILEKMAEELYREWFVRMRFPGHEKAKFIKGIPEGWKIKKFKDIIEHYIGGGWGEEAENINHPIGAFVIRGTDIPGFQSGNYSLPPFRYHKHSNYESRKLKVGDIVFEVSGGSKDQLLGRTLLITQGITDLCNGKVICASFCKLIRPKEDISSIYLKYFFKAYYDSGTVGTYQIQSTGISNYQFEDFLKYQYIIMPDRTVLKQYDALCADLLREKDNLSLRNNKLQISRDRLLSRLMSGKLDVEKLDIRFPKSMLEEELETVSA